MKKIFILFSLFFLNFYFSQQSEGLRNIKKKYDIEFEKPNIRFKNDISKKLSSKKLEETMAEKNKATST